MAGNGQIKGAAASVHQHLMILLLNRHIFEGPRGRSFAATKTPAPFPGRAYVPKDRSVGNAYHFTFSWADSAETRSLLKS